MNQTNRSRTVVFVGMLIAGWSAGSFPNSVAATDLPDVLVVVESANPRTNTLLEDMIGAELGPQESSDRRPSVSKPSATDRPLSTPIIVRPDGRTSQRSTLLREELMVQEVMTPDHSLGPRTPIITLEYGQRRLEVPLALQPPFIFDPAHGILVFDVLTLTPSETDAFASQLVTRVEPAGRPLPPIDMPGPSLTAGPESVAGLVGFIKSLAHNPDLGAFAVIGPAMAALGLLRRLRSDKARSVKQSEKPSSSVSSGGALASTPTPASEDQAPAGVMAPECTGNLPVRRSAA